MGEDGIYRRSSAVFAHLDLFEKSDRVLTLAGIDRCIPALEQACGKEALIDGHPTEARLITHVVHGSAERRKLRASWERHERTFG